MADQNDLQNAVTGFPREDTRRLLAVVEERTKRRIADGGTGITPADLEEIYANTHGPIRDKFSSAQVFTAMEIAAALVAGGAALVVESKDAAPAVAPEPTPDPEPVVEVPEGSETPVVTEDED